MHVLGLAGPSGSGKTTLMCALVPELVGRGHRVSTCKHAHHGFDVDQPGKDSHRHRAAGATEVMIGSACRWALMHELRGRPEPALDELVRHMTPVDLLLVEGFKQGRHDKLEVWRRALGQPLRAATDRHVVAVASDVPVEAAVPVLPLGDAAAIADFIEAHCRLGRRGGRRAVP